MTQKVIFSSGDLPPQLSDRARFNLWRDIYTAEIGTVDLGISDAAPFNAKIEARRIGPLVHARMQGSINRVTRTRMGVRADNHDDYSLVINLCDAPIGGTYRGNDLEVGVGGAYLHDATEAQDMNGRQSNAWANILLPRQLVENAFGAIDGRQGLAIAANHEPLVLLRRYLRMLEETVMPSSADLQNHIAETLLDLVGLATGAKGEDAELAGLRGLRAARLQAILGHIRKHFADPQISGQFIAQQLGLSVRYVHDLLQETGIGLSERVQTLRLQRARTMLSDPRFDNLRIGEIAHEAGFNDISHFNRSFRRAFGDTPGSMR